MENLESINGHALKPPFRIADLMADKFMKLYTNTTIFARQTNQTVGKKKDYYITLKQLNELINQVDIF